MLFPSLHLRARTLIFVSLCLLIVGFMSLQAIRGHASAASLLIRDQGIITPAANTIIVNSTADVANNSDGLCTLREAITAANNNTASGAGAGECAAGSSSGSDTIDFTVTGTINLTGALPNIASSMAINGPGSSLLTVRRDTGGDYRIFSVSGGNVSISGLTVSNGRAPDGAVGSRGADGGGITNSGTLILTDIVLSANNCGAGGQGNNFGADGGDGGGIYNIGTLTMTNSVMNGNNAGRGGNGLGVPGNGGKGGGIYNSQTLTMTSCIITGNSGGRGGDDAGTFNGNGGSGGGIYTNPGILTLTNVTISNNAAGDSVSHGGGGNGGGIGLDGNGTVTLTNSTVMGNRSGVSSLDGPGQGGGIYNQGTLFVTRSTISNNTTQYVGGAIHNRPTAVLMMTNSTISGNHATQGGGGLYDDSASLWLTNCTVINNSPDGVKAFGTKPVIRNTIIAGSSPSSDATGNFDSRGHNLIGYMAPGGEGTGFTDGLNGDQVGTSGSPLNPLLGPLANNGGSTMTHALLSGSPALDAGDDCVTQAAHCGDANIPQITTDQRGSGFNRITDGPDGNATATVDIGAYEKQVALADLVNTSTLEDTSLTLPFDVDDPGSITSVTAVSSNPGLVPNSSANLNLTAAGSTEILIITPAANMAGATDITITVNRTSGSSSKTITLTVNQVNDSPSFTQSGDQTVNENAGPQTVNNWATNISPGPNEPGQAVSFQVASNSNSGLFAVAPAISSTGNLTYTPAAGVSGTSLITIALKDDGGTDNGGSDTSATQTFNITVLDGGVLQFNSSFYSQGENNGSVTITVVRTVATAGEARINYATSDGTATAGQDYTTTSGTLIFANGVTTQTFSIPMINDTLDELDETVNLTLSGPAGSGSLGSPATATLTIFDDDPQPNLRINDVVIIEGESGTTNAVFEVTLSAVSGRSVTVNFSTANGTATSTADYQATSGTLTFNPGDVLKNITVPVNGDTVAELDEVFVVNLSLANGAGVADSQGTCTILTDDAPGGTFSFSSSGYATTENAGFTTITVNRTGNTSAAVTVGYATSDGNASLVPCATANGQASARCDFTAALGTLRFGAGEASKTFAVMINQDNFVEGPETLGLSLSNPTGGAVFGSAATSLSATLTISDDVSEGATNPIDDAQNFVRQHYHDFLNREPDPSGLAFWTDQIISCGGDQQCIELRRINVSAAFYLSIEFQQTGYLVERLYKTAYGNGTGASTFGGSHLIAVPIVRLNEFLPDTQEIGQGVVVGQTGWEQALETNKQDFIARFVLRTRFTTALPASLSAAQFVDRLNLNAGGALSGTERMNLINDLSTNAKTRAQVLRAVAEDPDLVAAESNRAFVLMQFFGYMRRNPNDPQDSDYTGYDFWLTKLNQFGGNFVNAEMVKAFINSSEYRQRFGQ